MALGECAVGFVTLFWVTIAFLWDNWIIGLVVFFLLIPLVKALIDVFLKFSGKNVFKMLIVFGLRGGFILLIAILIWGGLAIFFDTPICNLSYELATMLTE